eukprot:2074505-Rhodomonas_salina.1
MRPLLREWSAAIPNELDFAKESSNMQRVQANFRNWRRRSFSSVPELQVQELGLGIGGWGERVAVGSERVGATGSAWFTFSTETSCSRWTQEQLGVGHQGGRGLCAGGRGVRVREGPRHELRRRGSEFERKRALALQTASGSTELRVATNRPRTSSHFPDAESCLSLQFKVDDQEELNRHDVDAEDTVLQITRSESSPATPACLRSQACFQPRTQSSTATNLECQPHPHTLLPWQQSSHKHSLPRCCMSALSRTRS